MPIPAGMAVRPGELVSVSVACLGERGVGHVALRHLPNPPGRRHDRTSEENANGPAELEIKRMYVDPSVRGHGIGRMLLAAAEDAARAAGVHRMVLQTGDRQPEAVALYENAGYKRVPIFAPYLALPYSLCFHKELAEQATPGIVTPLSR